MSRPREIKRTHRAAKEIRQIYRLLGIEGKPKILLYAGLAYFRIDPFYPVLCLDADTAVIEDRRFVEYEGDVYVNKYAVFALIGQSTAKVAEQIMDYFFELVNLIETKGSVAIDEVMSRRNLESEKKFKEKLAEYNSRTIDGLRKQLKSAEKTNDMLQNELQELRDRCDDSEMVRDELLSSNQTLTEILTKLSRYVRIKGSAKGQAYLDEIARSVDVADDEYDSDELEERSHAVVVEAARAKERLKKERTDARKKITKVRKKIRVDEGSQFALVESLIERVGDLARFDLVRFDERLREKSELLEMKLIEEDEFEYPHVFVCGFVGSIEAVKKVRLTFSKGLISRGVAEAIIDIV
jgi:hypothetical protein